MPQILVLDGRSQPQTDIDGAIKRAKELFPFDIEVAVKAIAPINTSELQSLLKITWQYARPNTLVIDKLIKRRHLYIVGHTLGDKCIVVDTTRLLGYASFSANLAHEWGHLFGLHDHYDEVDCVMYYKHKQDASQIFCRQCIAKLCK